MLVLEWGVKINLDTHSRVRCTAVKQIVTQRCKTKVRQVSPRGNTWCLGLLVTNMCTWDFNLKKCWRADREQLRPLKRSWWLNLSWRAGAGSTTQSQVGSLSFGWEAEGAMGKHAPEPLSYPPWDRQGREEGGVEVWLVWIILAGFGLLKGTSVLFGLPWVDWGQGKYWLGVWELHEEGDWWDGLRIIWSGWKAVFLFSHKMLFISRNC